MTTMLARMLGKIKPAGRKNPQKMQVSLTFGNLNSESRQNRRRRQDSTEETRSILVEASQEDTVMVLEVYDA